MNSLLVYAVESSICMALLWGLYEIVLKKDTLHQRNRYYLLSAMLLSLVLPAINIRISFVTQFIQPGGIATFLLPDAVISASGGSGNLSLPALLPLIYLAGVIMSAVWLAAGSVGLLVSAFSGCRTGRIITVDRGSQVCFSAFGFIFISSSIPRDIADRMISHERSHISRMHHFDLIVAGLISVVQWFNPAAHLVRRSLQAVHEYEADDACITHGEDPFSYRQLLVNSVFGTSTPLLSNTFSHKSLLKKRIIMMTKEKSGNYASLKILLALPMAALLMLAFSCSQSSKENAPEMLDPTIAVYDSILKDNVFMMVDQQPLFMDDPTSQKFMEWVYSNIKYPEQAKSLGIQGKVVVRFIVDEAGRLIEPEVTKSDNPLLDEAALSALANCPDWAPAKYKGKPVKAYFAMPITFRLN